MAELILYEKDSYKIALQGEISGIAGNEIFDCEELVLPESDEILVSGLKIPKSLLENAGDQYYFKSSEEIVESYSFVASLVLTHESDTKFKLFDREVDVTNATSATLSIEVPFNSLVPGSDATPLVSIVICVGFLVDFDPGGGAAVELETDPFCFDFFVESLPRIGVPNLKLPRLQVGFSGSGLRIPFFDIDFGDDETWKWGFPTLPSMDQLRFPFKVELPDIGIKIKAKWVKFEVYKESGKKYLQCNISVLEITSTVGSLALPIKVFEIQVTIVDNGENQREVAKGDKSYIQFESGGPQLQFEEWHFETGCVVLGWKGKQFTDFVRLVTNELLAPEVDENDLVFIRVLSNARHVHPPSAEAVDIGEAVNEIRVDWIPKISAAKKDLVELPGIGLYFTKADVASPDPAISLVASFDKTSENGNRLALITSFKKDQGLLIETRFINTRGSGRRELQPDASDTGDEDKKLLSIQATSELDNQAIAIAQFGIANELPSRYFRQLVHPVRPLLSPHCEPVSLSTSSLGDGDWDVKVDSLLVDKLFQFPFLKKSDEQFIEIRKVEARNELPKIGCDLTVALKLLGTLELESDTSFTFDLENGAFDFDSEGIGLNSDKAIVETDFLGLKWRLKSSANRILKFEVLDDTTCELKTGKLPDDNLVLLTSPIPTDLQVNKQYTIRKLAAKNQFEFLDGSGNPISLSADNRRKQFSISAATGNFEMFKLITKDGNYQLRKAENVVVEVEYSKATSKDQPIIFSVNHFAITDGGVDLDAVVSRRPAKINGVNTSFTFTGGALQIRGSKVNGFSITGEGALPPALVGNATAAIALQFEQRDGGLELISGAAKLMGQRLLSCKGTRFDFSVDGLGLKFVNDGSYHLYFTVTGTARYVPLESDSKSGPLAWLPGIELQLIDCPLAGDIRVLAKHVRFLIELPKKQSFPFLGCFNFEIRAIGFAPLADVFAEPTPAMRVSGQIGFAAKGDAISTEIDFHDLFVGLPKPGTFVPQLHCKGLAVDIKAGGGAFELYGQVEFLEEEQVAPGIRATGFKGAGALTIKGLPKIHANFAFLRVSRDGKNWVRAWFVYAEMRKMSLQIPVINVYLREVGLGFGYRYTLVSIKAADEINEPRKLLKKLQELSLTQNNLSQTDQWRVDLEEAGKSPRWTVALRGLISQTSAAKSWTDFNKKEKELASLFVIDAVIALRSDLTFFMSGRGWLNTNYNDFLENKDNLRDRPLLKGFLLLSVRKKRLLANLSSNPNAAFGDHPKLPAFVEDAIKNSYFSATLLIEPGLFHLELGWPNALRWQDKIGPLTCQFRGGAIFRVSRTEIVNGMSFMARGRLELEAGFNAGSFGASLKAVADVAFGARYIGVIGLKNPKERSAFYAAVGVEINVDVSIRFWIRFKIGWVKVTIRLSLSFQVSFTAFLEVGVYLPSGLTPGIRGVANLGIRVMGRGLHFHIRVGYKESTVEKAIAITQQYLNIGLESTDAEAIPGSGSVKSANLRATNAFRLNAKRQMAIQESMVAENQFAIAEMNMASDSGPKSNLELRTSEIFAPNYSIYAVQESDDLLHFLLIPAGADADGKMETGFLPVPPKNDDAREFDFEWELAESPSGESWPAYTKQWDSSVGNWEDTAWVSSEKKHIWKVNWGFELGDFEGEELEDEPITIGDFSKFAFLPADFEALDNFDLDSMDGYIPNFDPKPSWDQMGDSVSDDRLDSPSDSAYEAAVRGAASQVRSAPYFKREKRADSEDENAWDNEFERLMDQAFATNTSIFAHAGEVGAAVDPSKASQDTIAGNETAKERIRHDFVQQTIENRSTILNYIIEDFRSYVSGKSEKKELAFNYGLVFRIEGNDQIQEFWDTYGEPDSLGTIMQRIKYEGAGSQIPSSTEKKIALFNTLDHRFDRTTPGFTKVAKFEHSTAICINWELQWPRLDSNIPRLENNIQDHLDYYLVHRKSLDGTEPDKQFECREMEVYHLPTDPDDDANGKLTRLLPRFKMVDSFANESDRNLIDIPPGGKRYVYTITPVDQSGSKSVQPLTILATRPPSEPPMVPTDTQFKVVYDADSCELEKDPVVREPEEIEVTWTQPVDPSGLPSVAVADRFLIFRREQILPIGNYGVDGETQGAKSGLFPNSNARKLRTDIEFKIADNRIPNTNPPQYRAEISLGKLRHKGIFPKDAGEDAQHEGGRAPWVSDAWRIFIQTESKPGIKSGLAPVQVILEFKCGDGDGRRHEQREPDLLEWIAEPMGRELLDRRDATVDSGMAYVPMPSISTSSDVVGVSTAEKTLTLAAGHTLRVDRVVRFAGTDLPDPLTENSEYRIHSVDQDKIKICLINGESATDDVIAVTENGTLPFTIRAAPSAILFRPHPKQLRCVHFCWNRAPSFSEQQAELFAGFDLYEFDVFSHTSDRLQSHYQNFMQWQQEAPLRLAQSLELIPGEDSMLTPGDTLDARQWEAWYPSHVRRIELLQANETQLDNADGRYLSNWYSWKDSQLVWPDTIDVVHFDETTTNKLSRFLTSEDFKFLVESEICSFDNGAESELPLPGYHYFLRLLAEKLEYLTADNDFIVDVGPRLGFQAESLNALHAESAREVDPHGWNVLKAMGLCFTFSLRNGTTGDLVQPSVAKTQLQRAIVAVRKYIEDLVKAIGEFKSRDGTQSFEVVFSSHFKRLDEIRQHANAVSKHLFVDQLFKPSRSNRIGGEGNVDTNEDLLAISQVGLRPIAGVIHTYYQFKSDEFDTQVASENDEEQTAEFSIKVDVPNDADGGRAKRLFVNSVAIADVGGSGIGLESTTDNWNGTHGIFDITVDATVNARGEAVILLRVIGEIPTDAEIKFCGTVFSPGDIGDLNSGNNINNSRRIDIPDLSSQPFALSKKLWNGRLENGENGNVEIWNTQYQVNWELFVEYLNLLIPRSDDASPIETFEPADDSEFTATLKWLSRFFDSGPDVNFEAIQEDSPYFTTAYQRQSTPVPIAPSKNGDLDYFHLIESRWGQAYRYILRPKTRYELLWKGILESPVLFPEEAVRYANTEMLERFAEVDGSDGNVAAYHTFDQGGLDVYLDRIKKIEPPLILFSGRMDFTDESGKAMEPGNTWSMAIAKHGEQTLIERNRTLKLSLEYEQQAFSLQRSFASNEVYDREKDLHQTIFGSSPRVCLSFPTLAQLPELPSYNDLGNAPDHYDVIHYPDMSQREQQMLRANLNIPKIVGEFGTEAIVLQFNALPHFYEHTARVVAQTASQVSKPTGVTQADFEYISPRETKAFVSFRSGDPNVDTIRFTLQNSWQTTPEANRKLWPDESPLRAQVSAAYVPYAWLPDLQVKYEVVLIESDSVSKVVGEIAFDPETLIFSITQPKEVMPKETADGFEFEVDRHFLVREIEILGPFSEQRGASPDDRLELIQANKVNEEFGNLKLIGERTFVDTDLDRVLGIGGSFRRILAVDGVEATVSSEYLVRVEEENLTRDLTVSEGNRIESSGREFTNSDIGKVIRIGDIADPKIAKIETIEKESTARLESTVASDLSDVDWTVEPELWSLRSAAKYGDLSLVEPHGSGSNEIKSSNPATPLNSDYEGKLVAVASPASGQFFMSQVVSVNENGIAKLRSIIPSVSGLNFRWIEIDSNSKASGEFPVNSIVDGKSNQLRALSGELAADDWLMIVGSNGNLELGRVVGVDEHNIATLDQLVHASSSVMFVVLEDLSFEDQEALELVALRPYISDTITSNEYQFSPSDVGKHILVTTKPYPLRNPEDLSEELNLNPDDAFKILSVDPDANTAQVNQMVRTVNQLDFFVFDTIPPALLRFKVLHKNAEPRWAIRAKRGSAKPSGLIDAKKQRNRS